MSAALRAELTKIRTVRSTFWTLVPTFAACVALSYLLGRGFGGALPDRPPAERAAFDPVLGGLLGLTLGQIVLVVFGVLLVSGEYTTGMIRASLTAVPRRGRFYAAKVAAGTLVALPVALVTAFASFFAAQRALGPYGTTLGADGALRGTAGAAVYMTLMCAFAMGVAATLRSTALSLGIMLPLLFLGSQGLGNAPKVGKVLQYLPDQAGLAIMQTVPRTDASVITRDFGPWTGLAILLAWTAAALTAGYLVLRRHDA